MSETSRARFLVRIINERIARAPECRAISGHKKITIGGLIASMKKTAIYRPSFTM
jgi:hypothetical protein